MVDWVALAGIGGTLFGAVITQAFNAWTSRQDRKHSSSLEFEKRVWESKSAALVEIIAKCQRLLDAADVDPPSGPSSSDSSRESQRRRAVLLAVNEIGMDLYGGMGGSLLAYGHESVIKPVATLSKFLSHEYMQVIRQVKVVEAIQERVSEFIDGGGGTAGEFYQIMSDLERAEADLGDLSTLDVSRVEKLCIEIRDAARKDLRGGGFIRK